MDKKFGFGCMRLPLMDKDDQTSFDTERSTNWWIPFWKKASPTLTQLMSIMAIGLKMQSESLL